MPWYFWLSIAVGAVVAALALWAFLARSFREEIDDDGC